MNKIIIAVGLLSTRRVQLLEDKYFNAEVIADMICDELLPEYMFEDYDSEYMYEKFGCETDRVIPIYFEHKIANNFGTYQFIKEITDKEISRKVIDKITKEDIERLVEYFK